MEKKVWIIIMETIEDITKRWHLVIFGIINIDVINVGSENSTSIRKQLDTCVFINILTDSYRKKFKII